MSTDHDAFEQILMIADNMIELVPRKLTPTVECNLEIIQHNLLALAELFASFIHSQPTH